MPAMPENAQEKLSDSPSFENALKRLEEIVHSLEEGETGLDESLAQYEEGVRLLRHAYQALQRAERRIELLSGVDAEGNPITRPLEDVSSLSLDERREATDEPSRPADVEKGRRGRRLRESP
jgi:exodeoxyribonuclease VII small subunit